MRVRSILHALGGVLGLVGMALLLCGLASLAMGDPPSARDALLESAGITLALSAVLWFAVPSRFELSRRDGVAVVVFGWIAACAVGALPFLLSGKLPGWAEAFFEAASGFTTTGATMFTKLEDVPRGLLLWRAVTQLLGGVGVLVLLVAILPLAGAGGAQVFRAELPGPTKDRVEPRIANNAKILWGVYLLLVLALFLLLWADRKMDWFEALCHSMSTLSTGGFSTRTASVDAFHSAYVEWVLVAFMFLGATNFVLHWRALRGEPSAYLRDPEIRFFAVALLGVSLAAAIPLARGGMPFGDAFRRSAFLAVSLASTTGFTLDDYTVWHPVVKGLLLALMIAGGVAGSTAGGLKVGRVQVFLASIRREVRRFLQPRAILLLRQGGRVLTESLLLSILGFMALYAVLWALGTLLLLPMVPDFVTALSAAGSALSNVGPGFGTVGPTGSFAAFPQAAKWLLSALMIAGRLELYTFIAVFMPSFWKK